MNKSIDQLTPLKIVEELNKFVVGHAAAKTLLAVAIRERWRRQRLSSKMKAEIIPSNILMKGPTGSGKTELCRRLASLSNAPFIRTEATRYTEKGYVGGDVNTIIEELVDKALKIVRKEKESAVKDKIKEEVEEIILNIVIPPVKKSAEGEETADEEQSLNEETRKQFRKKIQNGELDKKLIEIRYSETPKGFGFIGGGNVDPNMMASLNNFMERMVPVKQKRRKVTIKTARKILYRERLHRALNEEDINEEARNRTQEGFVVIDEIDKTTTNPGRGRGNGPDVSREGVQRDLLPLVEGTTIPTKIGPINTEHILFIAAGAFHNSQPTDLMPEFQGRFPIRATLEALTEEDYYNILTTPTVTLPKQQKALMETEDVTITFTEGALRAIAHATYTLNVEKENLGARRLRTVVGKVLEDVSFKIPDLIKPGADVTIDEKMVKEKLAAISKEDKGSFYII